MEVHAPEHPIHTWRDFFIHIATIVVGLLIAIGLEQSVEWLHHRHLIREARASIQAELDANHALAVKDMKSVKATEAGMQQNLALAQAYAKDPLALEHRSMAFNFSWSGFTDSAWRTARDTGALALLPTDEVQRYADTYGQQEIVNTQAIRLFEDEPQAAVPLFLTDASQDAAKEDKHQLLVNIASMSLRLKTLEQLLDTLQK